MEVTQEQLENMAPEEVAELQKQQCIFCHIVQGKVASKKVFEDEYCIGILDINPANPGHILLIPKEHYQIMPQMPDDVIGHLFMVTKHLAQAALKALQVGGVNVVIANGTAAGQKAPHFMIHIIPRTEGDGLQFVLPQKQISDKDLHVLKANIKQRIDKLFGVVEEEPIVLDEKPEKIVVEAEFVDTDVDESEDKAEEPEKEADKQPEDEADKKPDEEMQDKQGQADLDKVSDLFLK